MSNLYIPTDCIPLSETKTDAQMRLGLQGYPGTGKTWEALSFSNPIVLNYDRGLGAHTHRPDVIEVPFWNPEFVDKIIKRDGVNAPPNRKDATLIWLSKHAHKLTPEQTLVIDSCTQLDHSFISQYNLHPAITQNGKIDKFGVFLQKNDYFAEIFETLKQLKCNIIFLAHETTDRDAEGELNGGVKPLLSGQAGDKLVSHHTDWFRCLTVNKPIADDAKNKFKEKYGIDDKTLVEWLNSTPKEHKTIYIWQTYSDEIVKCKSSSLVNVPKFILANAESFAKYKRQPNKQEGTKVE